MIQFRLRALIACISLPLSVGSFTAQRGYSRDPAPREAAGAAITANEERAIAALPVAPPRLNQQYALKVEPSKHVTAVYTCKIRAPRLAATNWIFFVPRPPDLTSQMVSRTTMLPEGTNVTDLSPLRRPLLRAEEAVQGDALRHDAAIEFRIEAELFSRRLVSLGQGDSPIFAGIQKSGQTRSVAVANLTADQRRLGPAGLAGASSTTRKGTSGIGWRTTS